MRPRVAEWLGVVARLVAFAGLFVTAGALLAVAWQSLPGGIRDVTVLETVVTALAALAAGAVLIRGADGRSPAALGIALSRHAARHVGIGFAIGAAGLAVAALALLLTGALSYRPQDGTAVAWVTTVAAQAGMFWVAAFAEEALFRGYAFQVIARSGGAIVATVVSAVLFALAHGANPSVGIFALINIFLAGILLAIAYLRTLSLWFATALHTGWNWAMATLFDLPVSGLTMFDTPLYDPALTGPGWWSGSGFGPEGGLVGTIGFGVALLILLRWRSVAIDPAIAAARPLVMRNEEELHAG
jgi:membrane protease YdiL (CAAX protease family)